MTIISDRAEQGEVAVSTNVPKDLPPLIADRLRFIQVILNILSNAVKFTPAGGKVDMVASAIKQAGIPTHLNIVVTDTGIGMEEADIVKAFQSFGQVDSGLDRKYEGTGLGLPLCKTLLELHDGTINIESTLGVGTSVHITLPLIPTIEAFGEPEEASVS